MRKILNLLPWRRDAMERDLARELRYHVDRRVDDMMKAGVSEREARRRACIEIGGVTQVQEDVRDTWMWRWLDVLGSDLRYAARSLSKSWGFTLGAAAVLALGIGANAAIFSVVNAVLLRPLDYRDASRIVAVETIWTNTGRLSAEVSGPDFLDWQTHTGVFETLAHSRGEDDLATVAGDRADFANGRWVSSNFFDVFGRPASAGRLLSGQDRSIGEGPPALAVVRHEWAVRNFGSAQAAVGQPITVYGRRLEIVGVAAPGFHYPGATDVWMPDGLTDNTDRSDHQYNVVGKLAPSVELTGAKARMRAVGDGLARQHPENQFKTVSVIGLQERLTGNVHVTLWVLMGAVFLVLLIACANIANLLLARSASRTREIALRAALGAGRGRVVRQLLTESVVLAGIAAVAGLLLAFVLLRALVAMAPPDLPRVDEVQIDSTVLLFALGLSLASTVLFGLVPALNASRFDLTDALNQGGSKGSVNGRRSGLRSMLVVSEVALSVVLLAAAGLLLRSFQVLNHVDLGFTTQRVLVAYTQYVASNQEGRRRRVDFYREFLERLRAVPGVSAAAGAGLMPLGREFWPSSEYLVEGRPEGRPGERPRAESQVITTDYFKALEIPLRYGRDFDRSDTPDRPRVAIINDTFARAFFPDQSPIGQRLRNPTSKSWMTIVGVVADTRWRDPSQPPPAELYAAALQGAGGSLSILVRTTIDERTLGNTVRTLLREMNPSVPIRIETMEELFAGALAHPRFRTQLIGLLAGSAALLAAVGIFSVLAYLVGQRTRELAVRRAVGAQASDLIRLILNHGLRLVALGLLLGLAGALGMARLLERLLYGISPWDGSTYAAVTVVLGLVSIVATLLPAVRAVTIDPLIALRHE